MYVGTKNESIDSFEPLSITQHLENEIVPFYQYLQHTLFRFMPMFRYIDFSNTPVFRFKSVFRFIDLTTQYVQVHDCVPFYQF